MRFRLGTLQVYIALSAAPIWMLCEGTKAGCAGGVMLVWDVLVAAPLLLMCLVLAWVRKERTRERVIALLGAIAIVGYAIAIPASVGVIGLYSPWR